MQGKKKKEICDLYSKISEWFDKSRSKKLMEVNYLNLILNNLPLDASILDLGCGSGEPIAKYFIEKGFKVTGVDGSEEMIKLCKQRFPEMRWYCKDMRTLNLSELFNAIIAWDSFFHLNHADQKSMFKIFQKQLKPGGMLLFTAGPAHGEVYGKMQGYDFYHASFSSEEYLELLNGHGFELVLNKLKDPECGEHSVWFAKKSFEQL